MSATLGGFLLLLVLFGIAASLGGSSTESVNRPAPDALKPSAPAAPAESAEQARPAVVTTAQEMIDLLEDNALKAKDTYENKQVTVSGVVGSIDASGNYFALDPAPDSFILTGIQVDTDEKFRDQILTFTAGQKITITGKITNVGELIGYSLEAETIK